MLQEATKPAAHTDWVSTNDNHVNNLTNVIH